MTESLAHQIYTILIRDAGARDDQMARADFVRITNEPDFTEYRFQGTLGFGGKFRRERYSNRLYVDCYKEDETRARRATIRSVNTILAKLNPLHPIDD